MRHKLIAGNWKMYGTRAGARDLANAVVRGAPAHTLSEVLLCPPYVYLEVVAQVLRGSEVMLGAQDVCAVNPNGAYTGEVSAAMLSDCGCRYVIVGHSERRSLCAESDALVAGKFMTAQAAGLIPILCVGESQEEHRSGATRTAILRQFEAVVARAGAAAFARAVVAYEPVWAIGTGSSATPDQAQAVHAFIRARLAREDAKIARLLPILYGGSVKAGNAAGLFQQPDIDGALVGGASLDAGEFLGICGAAAAGKT